MNGILSAVLVLTGIGAVAALLLIAAAKFMNVPSDERAEALAEVLPGANCGACGFAGCSDYAAAVAAGNASPGLCIPGGDGVSLKMAGIMGVAPVDIEEKVAVVRCRGSYSATSDKYSYNGVGSCAAASAYFGGSALCQYGCLGYGDCCKACKFDAISVVNGVAVVDQHACTGCGACAEVCPKGIISVLPLGKAAVVSCRNRDRGGNTRKICSAGCIGCMRCQKVCDFGAVSVVDNLAVVDGSKCTGCRKCHEVCPVGCIDMIIHDQSFLPDPLAE